MTFYLSSSSEVLSALLARFEASSSWLSALSKSSSSNFTFRSDAFTSFCAYKAIKNSGLNFNCHAPFRRPRRLSNVLLDSTKITDWTVHVYVHYLALSERLLGLLPRLRLVPLHCRVAHEGQPSSSLFAPSSQPFGLLWRLRRLIASVFSLAVAPPTCACVDQSLASRVGCANG